MTDRPQDHDGIQGEVTAVDLALDALARRDRLDADPALTALASFARAVDGHAAALMMRAVTATPPYAHPASGRRVDHGIYADSAAADPTRAVPADPTWDYPTLVASPNGAKPPSATRVTAPLPHRAARHPRSTRPRRPRRRLLAVLALACLALVTVGQLSASPAAPLHPLHRLLFVGQRQPSPADIARRHLADARHALDRAVATTGSTRSTSLHDAIRDLAQARTLLPRISDRATRTQLDTDLASLNARATRLATTSEQETTPDADHRQGSNDDNGQHGVQGPSGPQDDSHDGRSGGENGSANDREQQDRGHG